MNLRSILNTAGKWTTIGLGYMTIESYFNGKINSAKQKSLDLEIEVNKELKQKLDTLLDSQLETESLKAKLLSGFDELTQLKQANTTDLETLNKKISALSENQILTENNEAINAVNSMSYYMDELTVRISKENTTLEQLLENLKKSIDSGHKFIDIDSYISSYRDFLSTLTIEQTGALANIFCGIVIFFCLITLNSIFFSDILLTYFKLEEKYPKIARFIKIRRQFQKFYFIVNSLIILITILAVIFINILSFY